MYIRPKKINFVPIIGFEEIRRSERTLKIDTATEYCELQCEKRAEKLIKIH